MPPDEPRRPAWSSGMWDEWDPEKDPALRRTREALQRPVEPPRAPERVEVESTPTLEPVAAPEGFSRRERIAQLIARVQSGDLSAVDALRTLLGG
jgi:hypothetical protein